MAGAALLVDTHLHCHGCFDRARFLTALHANLRRAAGDRRAAGMGVLTEMAGEDAFAGFCAGTGAPAGWCRTQPEEAAVVFRAAGSDFPVILVAGRQIQSHEGIEVLALATVACWADGIPLEALLDELKARSIPAVLPWGAGKWMGRRGRCVEKHFVLRPRDGLFAGDNAGRPAGWRWPGAPGRIVLPGSDPLPLPGGEANAGSCGIVLEGAVDMDAPAAALRRHLAALSGEPARFGQRVGPLRFARDQLRLRLA